MILSSKRCYYTSGKLMKSKILNRNAKLDINKSIIRPVITYGCQAWTLTKRYEQRLRIFENKILTNNIRRYRMEIGQGNLH